MQIWSGSREVVFNLLYNIYLEFPTYFPTSRLASRPFPTTSRPGSRPLSAIFKNTYVRFPTFPTIFHILYGRIFQNRTYNSEYIEKFVAKNGLQNPHFLSSNLLSFPKSSPERCAIAAMISSTLCKLDFSSAATLFCLPCPFLVPGLR